MKNLKFFILAIALFIFRISNIAAVEESQILYETGLTSITFELANPSDPDVSVPIKLWDGEDYVLVYTLTKDTPSKEFVLEDGVTSYFLINEHIISYNLDWNKAVVTEPENITKDEPPIEVDPKYGKYEGGFFGISYCYIEESTINTKGEIATNVNVGDIIVCSPTFETYVDDKVATFQYTLEYGNGLKLVKEDVEGSIKHENTYRFVLDEPTSVGDDIGHFTFEVVSTENLTYGIKNIRFITEANKHYYTDDDTNSLKYIWNETFEKYQTDAFNIPQCYSLESVTANKYEVVKEVKKGDKIVCDVVFETYANDKVKAFKYTLSYGKGLKLIKEEKIENATKKDNTYTFILEEPTSVGEKIGSFTFEVIDSNQVTYGIKDIKFITADNKYYTSANIENKIDPAASEKPNPETGAIIPTITIISLFLAGSLIITRKNKNIKL
ncbi:MAG: hypothetical protein IJO63_00450 [Bacilli bacterium]|nr:hypothetical protein [Bacilli bacterium]